MQLNELTPPLAYIQLEEKQLCLGHRDSACVFQKENKAKESGEKWIEENKANSSFQNCQFEIVKRGEKEYELFHTFKHIDDMLACTNYKVEVFRKFYLFETKEFTELVPILMTDVN